MKTRIALIVSCFILLQIPTNADEGIVFLKCTVSDDWIVRFAELAQIEPKPSKEDIAESMRETGAYEIELSFTPEHEKISVGMGTVMKEKMPYFITSRYVTYMTADDDGAQNSTLDRYTGEFWLNLNISILYQCERMKLRY